MIKPWIALAAIAIAATSLRAAEPITPATDKSNVISFGAGTGNSSIEYRRLFLNSRLAVLFSAGVHEASSNNGTASQHSTEYGLGVRHNFSTEQLRPFVQLMGSRYHSSDSYCGGYTWWNYAAAGGGEYFVGKRVSFEGSAGVNYGRSSSGCYVAPGQTRTHARTLDTFSTQLGINFYF